MNKQETLKALSVLKAAYPTFYSRQAKNDLEITVNLWETIFAKDSYEVVMIALKELISKHSGFPPDIAALRKQINDMTLAAIGEPTNEDLWRMLSEISAEYGQYECRKGFEKLHPILQRYCGVPETLRELSLTEKSVVNTVVKGQFMKQIESIRARVDFDRNTPEDIKELLSASVGRLPKSETRLSLQEVNERKNKILDALGGE